MTVERTRQSSLRMRLSSTESAALSITVTGELDATNVDQLRGQILDTLDRQRPVSIMLDLSRLTFIDAAGARTLYELHAMALNGGSVLSISHAAETTRWILSTLGFEQIFAMPAARRRHTEPGS